MTFHPEDDTETTIKSNCTSDVVVEANKEIQDFKTSTTNNNPAYEDPICSHQSETVSTDPVANPSASHNSNIPNSLTGPNKQHNSDLDNFFPARLHKVITEVDGAIKWLPNGKAFMITDKIIFSQQILPTYFGSSTKFYSFTRKLARWNFKRVSRGAWRGAYYHEKFVRDNRTLCLEMNCKAEKIPNLFSSHRNDEAQFPNYTHMHNIAMPNFALGIGHDPRYVTFLHPFYNTSNNIGMDVNMNGTNLIERRMIHPIILRSQNNSNEQRFRQAEIAQQPQQQQQYTNMNLPWQSSEVSSKKQG
jgi:hypothetical protein